MDPSGICTQLFPTLQNEETVAVTEEGGIVKALQQRSIVLAIASTAGFGGLGASRGLGGAHGARLNL